MEYALERLGVETVLMPPETLVREGRGRRRVRRGVGGVWVDIGELEFRPYYLFCRSPFVLGSRVGEAVRCRQHTTTTTGNVTKAFPQWIQREGMQGAVTTVTCKQRNEKLSLKCRKNRRKIAYYEQMPYSKLSCCCELEGKGFLFSIIYIQQQYSSTYVVEVTSICGSGTHQAVIGPCPCISPPNAKGEVIDGQHFHVWSAFQSSQHFSVSDTHILISFYICSCRKYDYVKAAATQGQTDGNWRHEKGEVPDTKT